MNDPVPNLQGVYRIAEEKDMNSSSTKRFASNELVQDGVPELWGASPQGWRGRSRKLPRKGELYAAGSQRMSRRRQGTGVTNEGSPSPPQQHLPWLRLFSKVTLALIRSRGGAISRPLALGGLWWLLWPLGCAEGMWRDFWGQLMKGNSASSLLLEPWGRHAGRRPSHPM